MEGLVLCSCSMNMEEKMLASKENFQDDSERKKALFRATNLIEYYRSYKYRTIALDEGPSPPSFSSPQLYTHETFYISVALVVVDGCAAPKHTCSNQG